MLKSTIELLNQAKGTDSDDLLALKVGITRPAISTWRRNKHVGPDCTVKLARLAGIDEMEALAVCAAESIQDEIVKASIMARLQAGFVHSPAVMGLMSIVSAGTLYLMSNPITQKVQTSLNNHRVRFEQRKHDSAARPHRRCTDYKHAA